MDKFTALSAPIRRDIVNLLAKTGQLSSSVIADNFNVSSAAISQHLQVLLSSKLVSMHKQAQQRIYELNPTAIAELESWAKQLVTQIDSATLNIIKDEKPHSRKAA